VSYCDSSGRVCVLFPVKSQQVAVLNSHVMMFSNSTVGVVDSLEEQLAEGVASENSEGYS
jgi:hypothetical protein